MINDTDPRSIFKRYYSEEPFVDRFLGDSQHAVDVIIPIIHTNELWDANLKSFYREIPINRLLISDGGCIDNSIEILKKYPRVKIFDHKNIKTLGYCIKKLIEEVETEWFVYPHSDVYLPSGWFDKMHAHQSEYDWFGCPMRITALVDYFHIHKAMGEDSPYMGSQMGKKEAFVKGIQKIDDDFVYRQEDAVFAHVVESNGYRHGKVSDTFHYHQMMHKESPWGRKIKNVSIEVEWSDEEKERAAMMQIKGVVKYLPPTPSFREIVRNNILELSKLKNYNEKELRRWIQVNNPDWARKIGFFRLKIKGILVNLIPILKNIFKKIL